LPTHRETDRKNKAHTPNKGYKQCGRKVIKPKIMNKNKRHISLKMSSVEIRTAHSRDRYVALVKG
jgi:hypothetical protein